MMRKFTKCFRVIAVLVITMSQVNLLWAKNYEVKTWINPNVALEQEKILFMLYNHNINQFEPEKPTAVVGDEILEYIPKAFYKAKSKCKPFRLGKYMDLYGFRKDSNFNDNQSAERAMSRTMEQARKDGYKYIALYLPLAQIRTVHVSGRSIPYTSYENIYVNGTYGSATARVPQQQYINIPDRDVPVLDVMVNVRVFETTNDFAKGTGEYLENCFIANSVYNRSREYRGGRVMDVVNEGLTIVTRELFGKKINSK